MGWPGGVLRGHIRYDNPTRQLRGLLRGLPATVENECRMLFTSHYGLDALYCGPDIKGAREKGGIEDGDGWFRRNFPGPVPAVATLDDLNGTT